MHKFMEHYRLFEIPVEKTTIEYKGIVFKKTDADEWQKSCYLRSYLRSYETHIYNKYNTVRNCDACKGLYTEESI